MVHTNTPKIHTLHGCRVCDSITTVSSSHIICKRDYILDRTALTLQQRTKHTNTPRPPPPTYRPRLPHHNLNLVDRSSRVCVRSIDLPWPAAFVLFFRGALREKDGA